MFAAKRKQDTRKVWPKIISRMQSAESAPSATSTGASLTAKTSSVVKASGELVPSIISEECLVIGNVISKGEVQLDGEIEGDIRCTSLMIGDKGCISGQVVAQDVVVVGRVVGSIIGTHVTLLSDSHVEADIYSQSLAIQEGAFFEGLARRSEDPIPAFANSEAPAKERASVTGLAKNGTKPLQLARGLELITTQEC